MVIVDDGSTDSTQNVIKPYLSDKRITYFQLNKNKGVGFARNYGIKKVETSWVSILDSDNEYEVNALKCMTSAIESFPNIKLHKFAVNSFSGKKMGERPDKSTVISGIKEFKGKFKGESRTLFRKSLLMDTPYAENVMGAEGAVWKWIALKVKTLAYHPCIVEKYLEEGGDRLSLRSNNIERLYRVWAFDIKLLWRQYLKHDPIQLIIALFKMISYWSLWKIKK